jgi:plasmid stabilization system protein ParE
MLLEDMLLEAVSLLESQPQSGAYIDDPDFPDIRALSLGRVRYRIYYRVRSESVVEIVAFWHTSRGTGPPLGDPA